MKRNSTLALHTAFKMAMRSSGDCSMLSLHRGEPTQPVYRVGNTLLTFPQPQVIQLSVRSLRPRFQNQPLYFFVPDECFLDVSVLEVHIGRSTVPFTENQLKYSHLNNRPPEVIGLASNQIQNVNNVFRYIESLLSFPALRMSSYTESTATFTFTPVEAEVYVVPQASTLVLFEHNPKEPVWDQDTVKMRFQRQNDAKCKVPMDDKRGVTFRELEDGSEFEIEFEKHVLQTYLPTLRLNVLSDCELKLIQVSRIINFESNEHYKRLFKYGMTREIANAATIRMHWEKKFMTPGLIQDLSNFPHLVKSRGLGLSSVFQLPDTGRYVLPRKVPLILHTTISNPRFKNDVVEMTFKATTKSCRLEIVNQNLSKWLKIVSRRNGIFKVTYKLDQLNANFPQGTEFVLKSSCDLTLVKASRKIFPRVPKGVSQIHLGSKAFML